MKTDLNRREFLSRTAGSACLGMGMGPGTAWAVPASTGRWTRQVDFYQRLPEKKIQCFVCPLHCTLDDGQTCFCRTRTNRAGTLYTHAYNNPCILQTDPVEKLPLNHFLPGTRALTIALGGCNLRCLYCQNWRQSQERPEKLRAFELTPAEAVEAARQKNIRTIAFGYTEPVAFLEYAKDIAKLAKRKALHVIVGTAAFIDPEPLLDFAQYVDAFSVTLKGFDEEFYKVVAGTRLEPVKQALITLRRKTRCWLEISNLIVPTYNDDPAGIRLMCSWVRKELGTNVPLHFARFVPEYRLSNLPRTPVSTLESARAIAQKLGLRYVYTSNIAPHEGNNTYCSRCRKPVIRRLGFKVLRNAVGTGACPYCHSRLPGRWHA